jgi:hypothetical protein
MDNFDLKKYLSCNPLLNEAKQVGDLYHFTPISNLKNILLTQFLYPNDEDQVSTSRRPNMSTRDFQDMKRNSIIRLTLDGDKISTKYKVRPFAFGADEGDAEDLGEEQIVVNGKRFPFIPYLKRIDIFLNKKEKLNDKLIELLEKANIPYKIYPGIPISKIPYSQEKTGNPEDINIKNIPKKEIYTKDELLYPEMKKTSIKVYQSQNSLDRNFPSEEIVWTSPKYPDYYITANELSKGYYYNWLNLNGEKFNIKDIPLPMRDDPKWMNKWKNTPYPDNLYRDNYTSYLLIPKKEI